MQKFRRDLLRVTVNQEVFSYSEEAGLEAGLPLDPLYVWAEEAAEETREEGEGPNRHKGLTTPGAATGSWNATWSCTITLTPPVILCISLGALIASIIISTRQRRTMGL